MEIKDKSKDVKALLRIADIQLSIADINDGILIDKNSGCRYFFCDSAYEVTNYKTSIVIKREDHFPKGEILFSGEPWGDLEMPYKWYVERIKEKIGIRIFFDKKYDLLQALVLIDEELHEITIFLDVAELPYLLDPFIYPLGILLVIYLVHFNSGLVVHASGVCDGNKGYLFSGLSGVGKSTMAKLWQQKGAIVINDDRLVVLPHEDRYAIHNTPMPYYVDIPKEVGLNGVFLLNQSKENYCTQLKGAAGMMRFMANCMQHFHSPDMVQKHLSVVEAIALKVPIFELGFKPDTDIVDLIRSLNL